MIKAVIYDLDDTLINTSGSIGKALNDTFVRCSLSLTCRKEEFLESNCKAIDELTRELKEGAILLPQVGFLVWYKTLELLEIDPKPKLIFSLYESFQNSLLKNLKLKAYVLKTLNGLRKEGIKIAILSNGSFLERMKKIDRVGIIDHIDLLVSSDLVNRDKPSPEPFIYTLGLLKTESYETLVVGDSIDEDIKPAIKLGFHAIYYNENKIYVSSDFLQISNHIELPDCISRINSL